MLRSREEGVCASVGKSQSPKTVLIFNEDEVVDVEQCPGRSTLGCCLPSFPTEQKVATPPIWCRICEGIEQVLGVKRTRRQR
jgi:hypothetical protein